MKTKVKKTLKLAVIGAGAPTRLAVFAGCLTLCMLALNLTAMAHDPTIITFDPPGSTFTVPHLITENGVIAGYYYDANFVAHGFLRAPDGKFTTFDAPGAGTSGAFPEGTFAWSHNNDGAVTGYYIDASNVAHGFLRAHNGKFTTFNAKGAGKAAGQGTFPTNINSDEEIAGYYIDPSNVYHSFVRAPEGKIITYDAPGAGTGSGQGTYTEPVDCINPAGAVAGDYTDSNNVEHGFVRAPGGAITTFDAPGAGSTAGSFQGTYSAGINPAGAITGFSVDTGNVFHGLLRTPGGKIVVFDAPGAGTVSTQGTQPTGINPAGAVTGLYVNSMYHGFVRAPDGDVATFDVPGAGCSGAGTYPTGINSEGAITGLYTDANCVWHGFLRRAACSEEHGDKECN